MALWDWSRNEPQWTFVVDTEEYAGNFEREMAAYVVGDRDGFGGPRTDAYALMFRDDHPSGMFDDLIATRVDDHGDDSIVRSHVALAPTPGWVNDGYGNHRKLAPGETRGKREWEAYLSVAIFLARRPTSDELAILARRARAFASLPKLQPWEPRPNVTGCRLVSEVITLTEEKVA